MLDAGVARLETLATIPDAGNDYAETTYRLLILCARQCGNQRLQRMLTALSLQTLRYSKLGLASVPRRQRSARLWRQATDALAQGDVERMVALTRQRIEESGEEAIRQLGLPATPGDKP
jgi:DNA-binding GntR family transcriptional regulator